MILLRTVQNDLGLLAIHLLLHLHLLIRPLIEPVVRLIAPLVLIGALLHCCIALILSRLVVHRRRRRLQHRRSAASTTTTTRARCQRLRLVRVALGNQIAVGRPHAQHIARQQPQLDAPIALGRVRIDLQYDIVPDAPMALAPNRYRVRCDIDGRVADDRRIGTGRGGGRTGSGRCLSGAEGRRNDAAGLLGDVGALEFDGEEAAGGGAWTGGMVGERLEDLLLVLRIQESILGHLVAFFRQYFDLVSHRAVFQRDDQIG